MGGSADLRTGFGPYACVRWQPVTGEEAHDGGFRQSGGEAQQLVGDGHIGLAYVDAVGGEHPDFTVASLQATHEGYSPEFGRKRRERIVAAAMVVDRGVDALAGSRGRG